LSVLQGLPDSAWLLVFDPGRDRRRAESKQERIDYEHAEFEAKSHRYELWSGKNPMPLWEWRHSRWQR